MQEISCLYIYISFAIKRGHNFLVVIDIYKKKWSISSQLTTWKSYLSIKSKSITFINHLVLLFEANSIFLFKSLLYYIVRLLNGVKKNCICQIKILLVWRTWMLMKGRRSIAFKDSQTSPMKGKNNLKCMFTEAFNSCLFHNLSLFLKRLVIAIFFL